MKKKPTQSKGIIRFHLGNPESPAHRKRQRRGTDKNDQNQKTIPQSDLDPEEEEDMEQRRKAEEQHPDEPME
jgi:hypothetical protein